MGINGVGSYQAQNYATQNRSRSIERNWSGSKDESIGNATSLSDSSNKGKKIGITTVGDKGYIAMYADSSTEQDPVVKVGDYEVRIKDVNPNNATKMEMFALMSYMDDKGLTNNQGMKSFNKMTAYSTQAEYNGYCSGISDENAAWTEERDWIAILENAKESYYKNPQTYGQGLECEKIIDNLKNWVKGSNPHIPDTVISRDTEYTVPDTNEKVAVNIKYVTSYSEDGISCTKEETVGNKEQSSIIWTIQFEDKEAFDKVKSFLEKVGTDKNLTFATQENFWKDFLVGNISDTEFMAYFESTNNGIIDFENGIQTGMSLRELVSNTYAGYLNNNNFVGHVYSEDDLQPSWYRGGIVNIQQEAEPVYTQKGVRDETVAGTRNLSANGYMELIRKQIEEMQEKIDNDEVNESFQIGGQTFTVEEWDEFLKRFDSIQDAMEALMKEHQAKLEKQQLNKAEDVVEQSAVEMIISESTSCAYPVSDANGEEVRYITWYTEEGVFCRKAGQTEGYEWSIPFENKAQFDKVMEFVGGLLDDEDLRFTANKNFWKDFFKDEIDVVSLKEKYITSDISESK